MAKKKRAVPEINASSMADIAFLLLIFFLVTTTIDTDAGMLVKLPQWVEVEDLPPPDKANKHNVLEILVNQYDQLLVEGELMTIQELKKKTKEFVDNNGDGTCNYCKGIGLADMSDSPNKAIVSLKNDRATSYDMYISVYNELKAAYAELRDNAANAQYGKDYDKLKDAQADEIKGMYQIRISEAEPESFGSEG
ncbi:MAG: biopolymer transporter ExbD [Bacteroidetes bacterium]|nr:biopolymer transporter ExbD [Bacteroidota bacterium]